MALATGQKVVSKLHNPGHGDLFPEYNRQRNSNLTQRLADLSPDTRDYVLYQRMQQPDMSACISKLPSRPTRIQHRRPTLNQSTNYHPIEFFNSSTSFAMWPDKESATTVSAMNGGRLRRRRKGLGIYPYGVHILTALEEVTEPESSDTEADSFISDAQSVITMNTTATISTTQIENSALLAMDWRVVVQGSRDSGFGETLELSDSKTDACLPNSDSNDSYNTKQSPIATITPTINATFINTNIITTQQYYNQQLYCNLFLD
ncbi:hypothetical protein BDF19DRAFT_56298 [Syncephalis fuscata]|nr:hypothetical protein BDF19DRAFT_56298 [Syncephalis fuscata]